MKNLLRIGMLLCSFLLASVGWAMAEEGNTGNTIYVDASSGSDESIDGTEAEPFATVQKALEIVSENGTIHLAAGTYNETSALTISKAVTIKGAVGGEKPTISGQTITVSAAYGAEVKFENLTLTPNNNSNHAVIVSSNAKVFLTNCSLNKCNNGVRMTGTSAELTLDNTDIDCSFYAISVRNINQKVTITGGTLTGWAAIMTSANEITSTDNSGTYINVSGATLVGRAILNGFSQDYGTVVLQEKYNGVTATFTDCTVSTTAIEGKNATQMSGLFIRSYANEVTFTGGSISASVAQNCQSDETQESTKYLHAALISLGHRDDPENSALTANTITISSTMNHVNGQFDVFSYRQGENKKKDNLTINGTSYSHTAGNILYGSATADCSPQSRINNAIDGEKIILAAGDYELSSQLTINKAITLEGAGSGEDGTKIVGQIVLEKPEQASEMTVHLNNLRMEAQLAAKEALVKINSSNTHLVTNNSYFYQKCNAAEGVAIAFSGTDFDQEGKECNNSTITLNNSTILQTATYNCRAISAYGGTTKSTGNKIKLVNSTIISTSDPKYAAYSRGVNFYKMDGASLEMDNSQIKGFAYGVNITDSNDNLKVNLINGSLVDSWTAFNIWSPNSTITVTGSKLVSQNSSSYDAEGWNNFSTVVFNERETITNNVITITDSEVEASSIAGNAQTAFSFRSNGNHINLKGNTKVKVTKATNESDPNKINENWHFVTVYPNITHSITCDESVSFITDNDKPAITVWDDETFYDALTSIDYMDYYGEAILKIPAGEYAFDSPVSLSHANTIEGAGIDQTIFKAATKGESAVTGQNLITLNGSGANGTTIKNLTIQNANNYGLHVYQAENITLENIELKDNLAGGMFVNGSKVTAIGIQTSGNVWGGIEVGKGKDVTTDPKLMISNSTLLESTQIWADTNAENYGSSLAGWVNAEGYSSFEYQPEGKNYKQTFWANRPQITIKVDKTTFIKEEGKTYQLTYTTTPANIEGITVKYCTKSGENYQEVSGVITEVGTYYVFFTRPADSQYAALNEMVVMTITNKSVPTIRESAALQETVLEAGLPLSMYHLIPGKAVVDETEVIGTYSWADGNQVLTEGENSLTYIFTPANLAQMDIVTGTINATAKRYFTVKTGVSANGKAAISNKSASDRYEKGTQLTLTATPDEGYTFTGWKDLGNSSLTYTVTEDKELVAEFAKKQFTVTFSQPANGSLSVKNGSETVSSGTKLDYGTILTVAVSANANYTADAITTTGSALVKGEIFLDANTTITATVTAIPSTPKTITITQRTGGSIRVTNKATGKEIVSGTQVTEGTNIIIERTPNKGYKLASEQAREEKTINTDETITATFQQETYSATASTGDGYTLYLNPSENLHYGDVVTITSSLNAGYKGIAMMVNEKEVPADGSFIVTGNMTVQYIVEAKAEVKILGENQSYVYNGRAQAFVVKTTPAGLTNVNVTYKKNGMEVGTPTDAGTYDVLITRAEDGNYKAFSATKTLTITQAPVIITNRPSDANGANGAASVAGSWRSGAKPENPVKPILRSETQYAIFTPSSENYAEGYCLPGSSMNMKVTISSTQNGTISVWDGNLQITNSTENNALSSSELTIYATPAVGYKLKSLKIGDAEQTVTNGSVTYTPTGDITVSAEFEAKATLSPTISNVDDLVYDGTVKTATISAGTTTGWNYSVQQNGITVSPINAGTYDVLITREEDDTYQAYRQLHSGALVINKATLSTSSDIIAPSATVLKGALLSTAALSGGASSTDGTFVWENPNQTLTRNGTANMKFIPSDAANFNEVSGISVTVNVTDVQAVTFTQPEHATLTVKRGETVLQSGDVIANGDVLTITVTPENGYVFESLKVNGSNFSNGGTYTVANGATVMIVATVKEYVAPVIPGGGGTVDPEPEIPTVSNPVVAERTATTAVITWEKVSGATSYKLFLYAKKTDSTPLKTYEFDKDGKLKATTISFTLTGLEEGKAYYIETAAYNALGTLLVKKSVTLSETPTGIESISEGSQLYTVKGAIVVAPAEPLRVAIYSVTGQTLFNDEVSYLTQVPAKAGIYVVVIQKGKERITEKVFVK